MSKAAGVDRQHTLQSGQCRSGSDCLATVWKEYSAPKGAAFAAIEGDDAIGRVLFEHNAVRAKQFPPIPRITGTRLAPAQPRKQKSQQALTC